MRVRMISYGLLVSLSVLAAAQQSTPSLELLEFLGTWETKDGTWMDPTQLIEAPVEEMVESDEHKEVKGNE